MRVFDKLNKSNDDTLEVTKEDWEDMRLTANPTDWDSEVEVEDKQDTHMIVTDTINQVGMYTNVETEVSSLPSMIWTIKYIPLPFPHLVVSLLRERKWRL